MAPVQFCYFKKSPSFPHLNEYKKINEKVKKGENRHELHLASAKTCAWGKFDWMEKRSGGKFHDFGYKIWTPELTGKLNCYEDPSFWDPSLSSQLPGAYREKSWITLYFSTSQVCISNNVLVLPESRIILRSLYLTPKTSNTKGV